MGTRNTGIGRMPGGQRWVAGVSVALTLASCVDSSPRASELACRIVRLRGRIGKAEGEASVAGELACRAALTFALAERAP